MIWHAIARLLHAVADRIEPERPEPEIQYVYVYSTPPATSAPNTYPPAQPWQSPFYYTWSAS